MSKQVYFADLTHNGTVTNADTFPYGVGCIAAYSKREFGEAFQCEIYKFPEDLNDALEHSVPAVLALSNFTWNHRLSMAFADRVKRRWPHVVVVMGGPNIGIAPESREAFLQEHRSVDFYVKWEGEVAFAEIFRRLSDHGFDAAAVQASAELLPNCLYLSDGQYIEGPDERIDDLMKIPSPYLTGYLDKFFDAGLRPLIETVRGCPYACTFCNDSHAHRNKVKRRTAVSVREELEYIATHMRGAADLMIADLNFGMYQEDLETARTVRSLIDRYGWPKTVTTAPGKSHPERVLETVRIINGKGGGVLKFAASMQSTAPEVLDAIKRKNLPIDKLLPMLHDDSRDHGDNTEYFTELILALPRDSKERHFKSLRDCIDRMRMNIINVHQLTLLQGTPLATRAQREAFDLDVRHRVFVGCIGTYRIGENDQSIAEIEEVVVGNNTMSFEDWLECRVMSLLVKIYIDRDYFIEVFGLIRRLGLSCFDLLLHLREHQIASRPILARLIERYLEKTVEPLHATHDEVVALTRRPDVVKQFARGELGGNELLIHRAQAYIFCMDELHDALKAAALTFLDGHGILDEQTAKFTAQAVKYSRLRKFDYNNFKQELDGTFEFDFVSAAKKNFSVLPGEVSLHPIRINFVHEEGAREEIDYALQQWVFPHLKEEDTRRLGLGNGAAVPADQQARLEYGLGKLFHMTNLRLIGRTATIAAE